ncbi:hypothetical protein VE02_03218 [Pseudogymnoascus sp. 03VT05]|nr:hypothetical protein VE02_03218 [Pseudogymnoascus sp. 03VT05]
MAVPAETVALVVTFVIIFTIVMLVVGICFIRDPQTLDIAQNDGTELATAGDSPHR